MEPYVVIIICAVLAAAAVIVIHYKKKAQKSGKKEVSGSPVKSSEATDLIVPSEESIATNPPGELAIKFEDIPALTETEETALVEIGDEGLLAKIDGVIPGTLKAVANTAAVHQYQQAVKNAGQMYRAIIPNGAVLSDSRAMEGAVRGIYHGPNGIQGHANLVPVDGNPGGGLAAMNVANAVMGVAAMVVGQYYMTQINGQLGDISGALEKVADFQDKEFQSKIYALVASVNSCSQFRIEIVEDEEQRIRELGHLKDLEHECAQLLGQANLTLKEFEKKKGLDYDSYEKQVTEAQTWLQYQQILLDIMQKIEELTYALSLGKVSREHCYSVFLPYAKQADEALKSLEAWHKETGVALEIDIDSSRRRRQGLDGILMSLLAGFVDKDELRFKTMADSTVTMIVGQSSGQRSTATQCDPDLFREDVRLIAKDGKLYYLPKVNPDEDEQ